MFLLEVFVFSFIGLCTGSNSFIEKFSNNLIRNTSTYYQYSIQVNRVMLETSSNLIQWDFAGYPLDRATWAADTDQTHSLDINVLDGNNQVRLYYSSRNPLTKNFAIGVASSQHLSWEMTPENDPLLSDANTNFINPGLIYYNNGSLLLTFVDTLWQMRGVVLTNDGLRLASDVKVLIKPSSPNEQVCNQWGIEHGNFLYIFYETGEDGVKVVRSTKPLGPYEEMPSQLVVNNTAKPFMKNFIRWGENDWPVV